MPHNFASFPWRMGVLNKCSLKIIAATSSPALSICAFMVLPSSSWIVGLTFMAVDPKYQRQGIDSMRMQRTCVLAAPACFGDLDVEVHHGHLVGVGVIVLAN